VESHDSCCIGLPCFIIAWLILLSLCREQTGSLKLTVIHQCIACDGHLYFNVSSEWCAMYKLINLNAGINTISNGNYEETITYLENSNKDDALEIIDSIKHHQKIISNYKAGDYEKVYKETELVAKSYPQYDKVKKLANDSLYLIINQNLQTAKDAFANQEYILAYNYLKTVLLYSPNQSEALQLRDAYLSKSNEMEIIFVAKKAEAEEKAK